MLHSFLAPREGGLEVYNIVKRGKKSSLGTDARQLPEKRSSEREARRPRKNHLFRAHHFLGEAGRRGLARRGRDWVLYAWASTSNLKSDVDEEDLGLWM